MVLGPIVTHSLGLNALFWMIAALATLGILLTIWVVPNSTNHVLNRESGMVKGSFSKVLAERGCSNSISALCVCIFY